MKINRPPDNTFFISLCIDRSNIQCTLMWHLEKNSHKVLRVFLQSLINYSPISCNVHFRKIAKTNKKLRKQNKAKK